MSTGTIVGVIAGSIVMFLLGWLFFGVVFAEYFQANMVQYANLEKNPPVIWAIYLFNLAWAALIGIVLAYGGRSGWAEGAKAGAIVMFVLSAGLNMEFFAFMNLHKDVAPMLVGVLVVTLLGAVSGAVIGAVKAYFERPASTAAAA
jgi:polyferredoxin